MRSVKLKSRSWQGATPSEWKPGHRPIGLDLPLRVLVWEDAAGKVWLTYHRPESLAQRHHVVDHDEAVQALGAGLAALGHAATAP